MIKLTIWHSRFDILGKVIVQWKTKSMHNFKKCNGIAVACTTFLKMWIRGVRKKVTQKY